MDISGQIKSSLIAELSDKNWKVRGEGLTKVKNFETPSKILHVCSKIFGVKNLWIFGDV